MSSLTVTSYAMFGGCPWDACSFLMEKKIWGGALGGVEGGETVVGM